MFSGNTVQFSRGVDTIVLYFTYISILAMVANFAEVYFLRLTGKRTLQPAGLLPARGKFYLFRIVTPAVLLTLAAFHSCHH